MIKRQKSFENHPKGRNDGIFLVLSKVARENSKMAKLLQRNFFLGLFLVRIFFFFLRFSNLKRRQGRKTIL
jgi:hypothetical protein